MATARFSVRPYRGRVSRLQLAAGGATLFLPDFGSAQTRRVTNDDRQIIPAPTGTLLTYLAHGEAIPGNMGAPGFIPLHRPAPVVVFENPDGVYFHYPFGAPDCKGALWLQTRLSVKAAQHHAAEGQRALRAPLPFGKARRASYLQA